MKIFISGPMTGYPNFNHEAFHTLAAGLRSLGYIVLSPAENAPPADPESWSAWMRLSIAQLLQCDVMCTLPMWQVSTGASIEVGLAYELDIPVYNASADHFLNSLNARKVKYFSKS
jgi:nucleoside 2-deoxyribosyltransferase